jgi:hypothetical protein
VILGRALLAALVALATGFGAPPVAAEAGKIAVEFNDLQQSETGCRAVFVLNNGLDKPLDKVTLRVVAFDAESHAKLFLSLDVGALPIGKTRVMRFDLGPDLACKDVSRIVLDDVTSCEGAEMAPPACLAAISLSSRAGAPFDF